VTPSRSAKETVSHHEVLVYLAFKANSHRWMTNEEAAALIPDVALRTVRAHTRKFAGLDIIERVVLSPAHKFRFICSCNGTAAAYVSHIERAAEILGLNSASFGPNSPSSRS
jgi:hypothetical protein